MAEHDPSLVVDQETLRHIADDIRSLRPGSAVAIDTEATGLNIFTTDELRGISVAYRDPTHPRGSAELRSFYVPISHPHSPNVDPAPLIDALHGTLAHHTFHNASYDWKALSQAGFKPRWGDKAYHDTETMAWLQNENNRSGLKAQGALWFGEDEAAEQKALKAVMKGNPAKHYMEYIRPGIRKGHFKTAREWAKEQAAGSKKTWATLTADDIAVYGAQDTNLTLRLEEFQRRYDYGETDPWPDLERELRARESIYRMMDAGVMFRRTEAENLRAKYLQQLVVIEDEFDVNLASPQQLARYLYDDLMLPVSRYTDSGGRSTDKEALEELRELHPAVRRIIEYRELAKMAGTYLGPMLAFGDDNDRIHSSLNITGTVTGRLTSSGPNMQNIPRDATNNEIKALYRAPYGFELIEVDLHSAELFVGASIADDVEMMTALSDPDRDFHTETAVKVFGNAEGQNRTLAKNLNYGIPYGIGAEKFATYLVKGTGRRVSKQHIMVARSIIQRHRAAWPQTHTAIGRLTKFAEAHNYIPLHVPGRYRHFRGPGLHVPAYTAFNAVVQGGVAELVKDVMIAVEPELEYLGARMVLQVHDSLWIEVPTGNKSAVLRVVQEVTDGINPFKLRLTWDAKTLGRSPE